MNPTPCIAPEEVGAVLALPAGDPRRAHLDTCPRCRALATAHRAFLEPPAPPAGARPDDADARLTAWRERFFAAPDGAPAATPVAVRPAEARRSESRGGWATLLAPAWRPAWAFAALVIVVGGALVMMRRPESTLRGGAPAAVTIEVARWLPDGGVRLAWHGSPDAARFEVRLYSTALEPLGDPRRRDRDHAGGAGGLAAVGAAQRRLRVVARGAGARRRLGRGIAGRHARAPLSARVAHSPSSPRIPRIASSTNAMWGSRSTPSSAALATAGESIYPLGTPRTGGTLGSRPRLCVLVLITLVECLSLGRIAPTAGAAAADPRWQLYGTPTDVYPFPLYDPTHRRMLMLGGSTSTSGVTLWSASLDSASDWIPFETSGTPPLIMAPWATEQLPLKGAVVDSRRNRLLVWGYQQDISGSGWCGTYALSLDSLVWSRLFTCAPWLDGTGVVYDPVGDRVLLFGGASYSHTGSPYPTSYVEQLDLSDGPNWSGLGTSGPQPTGRLNTWVTFDSRRNRLLVFGGRYLSSSTVPASLAPLDETWELTLGADPTWRFLPPAAPLPSARYGGVAFYDSLADRMLVYGGAISGSVSLGSDLWSLNASDPDTARWTHLGNPAAPVRLPTAVVLDPVHRVLVAGGGKSKVAPVYRMGARLELPIDGVPAWRTRVPDRDVPGNAGNALFDVARARLIVTDPSSSDTPSFAVWAAPLLEPPRWDRILLSSEVREGGSVIVDRVRDRLVLFGGTIAGVLQNSVWVIPLTGGDLLPIPTLGTPPSARRGQCAVYDAAGDRMIVFGGTGIGVHRPFYNDVWALTLGFPQTWSRLDLAGPRPPARAGGHAALDSLANQLLVIGGSDTLNAYRDLWTFAVDSGTWTSLIPSGTAPSFNNSSPICFDAARRRLYMIGPQSTPDPGAKVWTLNLGGTLEWSQVTPEGFGPGGFSLRDAVFNPASDMLVLACDSPWMFQFWGLFLQDATTPVTASLVAATADAKGVHVIWSLADASGPISLERRVDQGAWQILASLVPDGEGLVRYDDPTVEPGHAYDYSLILIENGATVRLGLASLFVPPESQELTFDVAPNPAGAVPRFVVALPQGTRDAQIELFDIGGRRVRVQDLVTTGGRAPVDLDSGGALHPGIYQARLLAGGRVIATRRVAVLR